MLQTKRTPAIVNDIAPGSEAMKKDVDKFVTDYKVSREQQGCMHTRTLLGNPTRPSDVTYPLHDISSL